MYQNQRLEAILAIQVIRVYLETKVRLGIVEQIVKHK
jgi:hypothetical protein